MSKDESNGAYRSATAVPSDRTGYQPLNEGYVPFARGDAPKTRATSVELPSPPKGGTGVTSTISEISTAKD
jgi:hypothetical protein